MRVSDRDRENFQEWKQTCVSPCLFQLMRGRNTTIGFPIYCTSCADLWRVLDELRLPTFDPWVVSLDKDHAVADGGVVPGPKLGQLADIGIIERTFAQNLKCL